MKVRKKKSMETNSQNNKCWRIKFKKKIKKDDKKSQLILTLKNDDHGHEVKIDCVEGKP
jgi:hypothetical protein